MIDQSRTILSAVVLCWWLVAWPVSGAAEPLVIAASPAVRAPLEALGRAFEATHPGVSVRLYLDSGLELRRTIAAVENDGRYLGGRGVIHLVAPGGDELITRLEAKNYIRPNTRRAYAAEPLVLVVPASLVEAPASFEQLANDPNVKIAVADPALTSLGQKSRELLVAVGVWDRAKGRLEVAADARGVIDHMMRGQSDVGILAWPEAVREQERIRVVAWSGPEHTASTIHSIAMEWECPNRALAQDFLDFTQTPAAQAAIRALGYAFPTNGVRPSTVEMSRGQR